MLIKQSKKYDQPPVQPSSRIEDIEMNKRQSSQAVIELTREELYRMRLLSKHNQVLVKIIDKNADERTPSGIWKNPDTDFNKSGHADRIGQVVKVPESLYFKDNRFEGQKLVFTDELSMDWQTEMMLKLGDIIWFDYLDSLNCTIFKCEEDEYKLIKYESIYLAKRDVFWGFAEREIVMLNGYCLFEPVFKKYNSKIKPLKDEIDPYRGIARFIGEPNKAYRRLNVYNQRVDSVDFEVGDICIFEKPYEIYLEGDTHLKFNGNKYRVLQRKDIVGVETS